MVFRCTNTGGDAGFKFFCERDEDDLAQVIPDTIRLGPFTVIPQEFYLTRNAAIDIFVSYSPWPQVETDLGPVEENLILACDNQTSEFYKLVGTGCKLNLDVTHMDGREVDTKIHPLESLFFEMTNPGASLTKVITFWNSNPIPINYHWSVYKSKSDEITLKDDETHYRIEPDEGVIAALSDIQFRVIFTPTYASAFYEYADLILD